MITRLRRLCTLAIAAVVSLVAYPALAEDAVTPTDKPFLWLIEGDTPSFLYGTVHLPDDRVLALPEVVETAFAASDAIYTEIPLDMNTQMQVGMEMMLSGDESLSKLLPEDLYQRTDAYVKSKGLSLAMLDRVKVYAVAIQLPVLDYLPVMATKKPLDAMLYARAGEEGKETKALETVDEQLAVFEAFDLKEQIQVLKDTVDYLTKEAESGESATEKLLAAYLGGNLDELDHVMREYMDPDDPLYQKFAKLALTDRNHRMADRIGKVIQDDPGKVNFFAVGALHYDGDEGILHLLREAGYSVKRLDAGDTDMLDDLLAARAE